MAKQSKKEYLFDLLEPKVKEVGYHCVDVDFVKVAKDWILTVYINKPDGIGLDDCATVSGVLSDYLDEVDPIEQSYLLEVSSPGLDRPFKRIGDYENAIGTIIDVRLFAPVNGTKELCGTLDQVNDNGIIIKAVDSDEEVIELSFKMITKASPHIEF